MGYAITSFAYAAHLLIEGADATADTFSGLCCVLNFVREEGSFTMESTQGRGEGVQPAERAVYEVAFGEHLCE